jgi:hypothetical protein
MAALGNLTFSDHGKIRPNSAKLGRLSMPFRGWRILFHKPLFQS